MSLDLPRTQRVARQLAMKLGLSVRKLAQGILRIANANMERAIRVVSVQRGFDPREFALLAFGGAGGLHACDLASSLDIDTVLIPEHSGVLSALGMLLADVVKDYSTSILQLSHILNDDRLRERLSELSGQARADLISEGFAENAIQLAPSIALRYKGQAFEIDVPFSHETMALSSLRSDFHQHHARLYGYSNPSRATEAVQLRLRASGRTEKPSIHIVSAAGIVALPAPEALRKTIFTDRPLPTPIFHRARLTPGMTGDGPTMIVSGESTNIIPPNWTWRIDGAGTLIAISKKNMRANKRERVEDLAH